MQKSSMEMMITHEYGVTVALVTPNLSVRVQILLFVHPKCDKTVYATKKDILNV
jgi:hypothetical protein